MTVKEAIAFVDDIKPNAFTNLAKTRWLSEAEGMVQTEVLMIAPADIQTYTWTKDQDTELIVAPPHDKLYTSYLAAMIDYANGEYDRYQNAMQLFNAHFGEFMAWFADTYRPADDWRRQG